MHNPDRFIHCERVLFSHRKTQAGEEHWDLRSTEPVTLKWEQDTQVLLSVEPHSTAGAVWSNFWGKHYEELLPVVPLLRMVTRGPGVIMWTSYSIPSAGMLVVMNYRHSFPRLESSTSAMVVARYFTSLSTACLCSSSHAHLSCTPKPCPFQDRL